MGLPLYHVDAFTDTPFGGNPAAVCLLAGPVDAAWLRLVARELNLPATAFVHPAADGFALRWFSPTSELELCGHGTLASAHVLWEAGRLRPDEPARFQTASGRLAAARAGDWIELDFPAEPPAPVAAPPELVQALGVAPRYVGRNRLDYLVEVGSAATVRDLAPDLALLKEIPTRGVIVTSRADGQPYDIVSRFFAPRVGIGEDQVTGSAHCCLGPYWSQRLMKPEIVGYQASARGGVVRARPAGDRIVLGGQAVTIVRGELV